MSHLPLVAYFCFEFALDDRLPIYSGGLGVLAGDMVKEANSQEFPLVGVGLFYKEGFFKQWIVDGHQVEAYEPIDPHQAGLKLALNPDSSPIIINLLLGSASLYAQIWQYTLGTVNLILLDTNISQNREDLRDVTKMLYGGDIHTRIQQEIVLGIGGVKALKVLGYKPDIYHLNEGHSAFAIFELIGQTMRAENLSFEAAAITTKKKIIFTNHTLVAAGNDVFLKSELINYFQEYAKDLSLPIDLLLDAGTMKEDPRLFTMTHLALAYSNKANAVSHLHSLEAKKLWPDYNLLPVTNGVYLPMWVAQNIQDLSIQFKTDFLDTISNENFWQAHLKNKNALIREITSSTGVVLPVDQPIIVWARRFADYKQPDLLFKDIDRLKQLLESPTQPFKVVISGRAHPEDRDGKKIIKNINQKIIDHNLLKSVVFLPHYTMTTARLLTTGADVWLNTPVRGHEACGTSGMKSGANGVLQCSIKDGWLDEVDWDGIGWIISNTNSMESLYEILERQILPLYYNRDKKEYSEKWLQRMKATIKIIWPHYSSTRMLDEYKSFLYNLPNKL